MSSMRDAPSRRRRRDDDDTTSCPPPKKKLTLANASRVWGREPAPLHIVFECATGYTLFLAHGINDIDILSYQAAEEYINRSDSPFELKAYLPFSSLDDALVQFNAVSKSTVTDKLMKFIKENFKPPYNRHSLAVADPMMGLQVARKLGLGHRSGLVIKNAMRGLREKIDKLIGLQPGELDKAQCNLARLYNNQTRSKTPVLVSSSSFLQEQVRDVVPHRFEGFFNAKGKNNILCTRNLVPGEALYGEKLLRGVQNDEDRTEFEYRVWDPSRSKLGAAILGGVTNIWIKPGSRVIYVGNVCGLTVSDLSDLVGLDGLVFVVGCSDDVADMAGKRPNVVTFIEKNFYYCHYRMLFGMVDVIFAEIDRPKQYSSEGQFIVNHARHYLRVGGHYMISAQANDMNVTGHAIFTSCDLLGEFKLIETVRLEGYVLDVGGYRIS